MIAVLCVSLILMLQITTTTLLHSTLCNSLEAIVIVVMLKHEDIQ